MNYRIKEVCRQKRLMMKDLAEKLGMIEVGLSKSLNGNPTVSRLEEITKVLGVDFMELFEQEGGTITCLKCGTKFKMEE
ncbi:MAG: helix-turn-helix domain-containing protein [Bacteroides xylanisolvens]